MTAAIQWQDIADRLALDNRMELSWAVQTIASVSTKFIEQLMRGTPREIAPGGEMRPGKRARAEAFLRATPPDQIAAPILTVYATPEGPAGTLVDGRHRWSILRDNGCEWINCCVTHPVARWLRQNGHAKPEIRRART